MTTAEFYRAYLKAFRAYFAASANADLDGLFNEAVERYADLATFASMDILQRATKFQAVIKAHYA